MGPGAKISQLNYRNVINIAGKKCYSLTENWLFNFEKNLPMEHVHFNP
jgi:hypothetical protein